MRYLAGHEQYQESYMALARLLRRPWLEVKEEIDRASIRIMNSPMRVTPALTRTYLALHASTGKREALTRRAIVEAIKVNLYVLDQIHHGERDDTWRRQVNDAISILS